MVYITFSNSTKSGIPGISLAFCSDYDGESEAIVRITDGSSAAKSDLRREAVGLVNRNWGGFEPGITIDIWQTVGFNCHVANGDNVVETVAHVLASYLVVAYRYQAFSFDESLKGMLIFSDFGDRLDVLQVNDIYDIQSVDLVREDYDTLATYFEKNK